MPSDSRQFDRAAPFYDRTRGLPAEVMDAVADLLRAQLAGRGRCVEIGVGTGRIALPLHERGVPLAGLDLSRAMMDVLVEKADGVVPFPLALADATALPFPDAIFGAGLASHVFHLIPDWRAALAELVRVIEPGGLILTSRGSLSSGSLRPDVRSHFEQEAGEGAGHIGLRSRESGELEAALAGHGATETVLPSVGFRRDRTIGSMIDELEAGCWSSTWSLGSATVAGAAARTRAWAEAELGPLDVVHSIDTEITWKRFDLL